MKLFKKSGLCEGLLFRWAVVASIVMGLHSGTPVQAVSEPAPEVIYSQAERLIATAGGSRKNIDQAIGMLDGLAKKKFMLAMIRLAQLYGEGIVIAQNSKKMIGYLNQAIDAGSGEACLKMTEIYRRGLYGVVRSAAQTVVYAERLVQMNLPIELSIKGFSLLIEMHISGEAGKKNRARAFFYLQRLRDLCSDKQTEIDAEKFSVLFGEALEPEDIVEAVNMLVDYYAAQVPTDKRAARFLGNVYANVDAPVYDLAKAFSWYTQAAERGDAASYLIMGELSEQAQDVDDAAFNKAAEYYKKAAALGLLEAYYRLYMQYSSSDNVQQNKKLAVDYLYKAAEAGDVRSMYTLGDLLLVGEGVSQDLEQGRLWLERAAGKGCPFAFADLSTLYRLGHGVEKNPAKARRLLEEVLKIHPHYALAHCYLGELALEGEAFGGKADFGLAQASFERSIACGFYEAAHPLALMYATGRGIAANIPKAYALLEEGARHDSIQCCTRLAYWYHSGEHGLKDFYKAAEYAHKASLHKFAPAQALLGRMYLAGEGVKKDLKKAAFYLGFAAKGGDVMAKALLARLKKKS